MTETDRIISFLEIVKINIKTGIITWNDNQHDFSNRVYGQEVYSKSTNRYLIAWHKGKSLRIHRVIFFYTHGFVPKMIDHINQIKDDNRPENLRQCTGSQNQMNKGLDSNNTSGIRGVSFHKRDKLWQTIICVKGKNIYLGGFKTKVEAILVRHQAEKKYFGQFRCK